VGLTKRSGLLGAMMPLEYARRLNRTYGREKRDLYSQAVVQISSLADYEAVSRQLTEAGFALSGGVEVFRKVRGIVLGAWSVLAFLAAGALLLAFVGLFNAFNLMLHERRALIGLTRSLGATIGCVRVLLLSEALLIGALGGLLGCVAGGLLGFAINTNLEQLFPELLILPNAIFITGWEAWLLGFILPVGGALFTPLLIVRKATARPPSLLLGEAP
jgi:ABC-type antimicrobial peptide transport system permease subunit